jgi:hypothetical protein
MKRPALAGLTVAAALTLAACGDSYIDTAVTTLPPDAPATTVAAIDPNAPLPVLLDQIEGLMFDLDQRIIDKHEADSTLTRINDLWSAAEPGVRATDLDSIYNFEEVIGMARTAVTRRRPADASKAYKLMVGLVDNLTAQ